MLFVYFANILPQISHAMSGMLIIGVLALILWIIFGGMILSDYTGTFNPKAYKKPIWIIGIPVVILATLIGFAAEIYQQEPRTWVVATYLFFIALGFYLKPRG
jgi:hypothetical protein